MQLVEQHVIGKHDPRYELIDAASFVNGSYNILRKAFPNVFADNGVEGAVVHPVRLSVQSSKSRII